MAMESMPNHATKVSRVIPFPTPRKPSQRLGTPPEELEKLAVLVHLRALRSGKASSLDGAMSACRAAATAVFGDDKS